MTSGLVLVAGGTGRLGSIVVQRLSDSGVPVRVMTRDPERAVGLASDRVTIVRGDVRDEASTRSALEGVSVVLSAIQGFVGSGKVSPQSVDRDGNRRLLAAAEEVGAEVVLMSTVGAARDSPMELFRMKFVAEQLLLAGRVPATIVRATAFAELWIDLMRQTAGSSGHPVVFGRGRNPINFVSVGDVAALVERAVVDSELRGQTLEIGGPADLTLDQLALLAVEGTGGNGKVRHVPRGILSVMARTVGAFRPELARQARAALVMDRADMTFPGPGARAQFKDLPLTSVAELVG